MGSYYRLYGNERVEGLIFTNLVSGASGAFFVKTSGERMILSR